MTPLPSARLCLPAQCPRRRHPWPWPKSSRPHHCLRLRPQECLPTPCPTAPLPACRWALLPKARSSRPPSRGGPRPPFPTVGPWAPRTRPPSRDPGLLRATPGPHKGACHPGLATLCPPLVPLAPGTPWRGPGRPVLVILSSTPTSRREANLLTQRSPRSQASRASPSPQGPLGLPTTLGLPPPTGFHHLRVLLGLGIRQGPGPGPFPTSARTAPLAHLLLRFEVKLEVESALPMDLGGPGWESTGPGCPGSVVPALTGLPGEGHASFQ